MKTTLSRDGALGRLQKATSETVVMWVSHHLTLFGMTLAVAGWCVLGFLWRFALEWLLLTNIIGSLVSFLILLLVQHSRARHTLSLHAKLDELIRSGAAGNHWIGVERHTAETVEQMRIKFHSDRTNAS